MAWTIVNLVRDLDFSSFYWGYLVMVGVANLVFSLFTYPEDPSLLSIENKQKLGESYLDVVLLNPMFGEFDNPYVDSTVALMDSVMAHEMGHMEKRHVIARLVKELGIEILSSGDPYVIGEVTDNELMKHFEIISTHPNFRSRIREALSYVPEEGFEALPFELNWEGLRSELK